MSIEINKPLDWVFHLKKAAPLPITFWVEDNAGVPVARDAVTLTAKITHGATTITKSVGNGIVIAMLNPETQVTGAIAAFVTITLTAAEIAAFKLGNYTAIEVTEGAGDPKTPVLSGRLVLA